MSRTILITGATDGLGRALALKLAGPGVTLLLHGRDARRGDTVLCAARDAGADAALYLADLASLAEVRGLATAIAAKHDRLDLLINNAGIGFGAPGEGRRLSADGYELRFAINYLAPVLLTESLIPLLAAAAPSRVVNVASIGQYPLNLDDLMLEHDYSGARAYRQAKLAMIMWTIDLAAALEPSDVTVNALHPATFMDTTMVREAGGQPMSLVDEGVEAVLNLALSPGMVATTGAYFDGLKLAQPHPQSREEDARAGLREATAAWLSKWR